MSQTNIALTYSKSTAIHGNCVTVIDSRVVLRLPKSIFNPEDEATLRSFLGLSADAKDEAWSQVAVIQFDTESVSAVAYDVSDRIVGSSSAVG